MNPKAYNEYLNRELRNVGQWGKAIFDTGALDRHFADEEFRNQMAMQRLGQQKLSQERTLDMGQKRLGMAQEQFDFRSGLQQKMSDRAKSMDREALPINLAGLGLAAGGSYAKVQQAKKDRAALQALTDRISGMGYPSPTVTSPMSSVYQGIPARGRRGEDPRYDAW